MLLPRESAQNPLGFRLRKMPRLAILFRPTRRECCPMANEENTAVNELIARASGGPTGAHDPVVSDHAVTLKAGALHTALPTSMPVVAPFETQPGAQLSY